jgi:hypothetical protein
MGTRMVLKSIALSRFNPSWSPHIASLIRTTQKTAAAQQ